MKIIIGFFIFCIVLFLYLHIQFHLKTGNDLEMYEIEETSKDKLEEICDLRQPVLFDFDNKKIIDTTNKTYLINNYHAFEIKIRNIKDAMTLNYMFLCLYILPSNYLMKIKTSLIFLKIIQIFYRKQGLKKIFNTMTNF